jgi:lysophospholipase L1-like esterase
MRVLVFGDSISYGAWDTEAGWVERLKREAHIKTVLSEGKEKVQIINLGIGGDTSTKILKRISSEIEARHSNSWPFVFLIMIGTNDERSVGGEVETSVEQFENNIRDIIKIAKQYSNKIAFLGIPPLGKPVIAFKGQEYSDERVKVYEQKVQAIAYEADLIFEPVRPAFEQAGLDGLFAYDFLHPNDKGHALIAEKAELILDKFLKDK